MNGLDPEQLLTRCAIRNAPKGRATGLKVSGTWAVDSWNRLVIRLFGGAWHVPAPEEVERVGHCLIWQKRAVLVPNGEPADAPRRNTSRPTTARS
jgi:hypothetical protein